LPNVLHFCKEAHKDKRAEFIDEIVEISFEMYAALGEISVRRKA
jgi:hypothetical protein